MICGSGGSKSRLAKAAGAEPAGQRRDEKLHAVVARSTFPSHKCTKHTRCGPLLAREMSKKCKPLWREAHCEVKMSASDHFWKLRCRKSARRCGAKHISKWTCTKHTSFGPLLEVEMSKKCTPLWREAHFEVNMYKTHQLRTTFGSWDVAKVHAAVARSTFPSQNVKTLGVRTTFGRSDLVSRGRRKGLCTVLKVSKTWGFCSISKNDGRRGTFEEDLQRRISPGRRGTRDMFIRDVRRSGRWFPERGCISEHQTCRFPQMILRDRCSTSYDLASIFRGRRSTFNRWSGKIAQRIGTRPSALHSTFHFWRKSCRIASFWMFSRVKIEEVSQNCFVLVSSTLKNAEVSQNCFFFDVVNFEKWGSHAESLRFWCRQLWKMKKSRRIVRFSSLQIER